MPDLIRHPLVMPDPIGHLFPVSLFSLDRERFWPFLRPVPPFSRGPGTLADAICDKNRKQLPQFPKFIYLRARFREVVDLSFG